MKDFLFIFILVGALGYLSTFLGVFGVMAFASGVIAVIITMLLRLHAKLDVLGDWLEERKEEAP